MLSIVFVGLCIQAVAIANGNDIKKSCNAVFQELVDRKVRSYSPEVIAKLKRLVPEPAVAQVFDHFKTIPEFGTACSLQGCETRQYLISNALMDLGYTSYRLVGQEASGSWVSIATNRSRSNHLITSHHVATVVEVPAEPGSTKKLVLDHALFDRPVPYEIWVNRWEGQNNFSTTPFHVMQGPYAVDGTNQNAIDKSRNELTADEGRMRMFTRRRSRDKLADQISDMDGTFANAVKSRWFRNWWNDVDRSNSDTKEKWKSTWAIMQKVLNQTKVLRTRNKELNSKLDGPFGLRWYSMDEGPALWSKYGLNL